ncbi:MAG TPA: O-antigen ligase family protein [Verrucomicrobiae bacterium]|jgi:hypothetical protein
MEELIGLAVCCIAFFLTFSIKDLTLWGAVIIATAAFFFGQSKHGAAHGAIPLLFGVTVGRMARFFLIGSRRHKLTQAKELEIGQSGFASVATFFIGLILLLAFSSWWHLDVVGPYHGPRWMGLWDNPNDYGVIMSAGMLLAIGLRAGMQKEELRIKRLLPIILFVSAGMMGVGLVMSYSRGAWLGTVAGLLYLANSYRKFKWRSLNFFLLSTFCILLLISIVYFFWNATPDSAPWYVKRMDLGRPSAQHRVAAWKAGFEIMRDHPLGVGWNKTVEIYQDHYSPPPDGAGAITTNDYLMLGTQLGIPALLCFLAYVALCLGAANWVRKWRGKPLAVGPNFSLQNSEFRIKTACRSAALSLLVAFWFDGGLFQLPTAVVFWILLELGAVERHKWQIARQQETII